MDNELWDQWSDCHNSPDQVKRIASAKKAACTPTFLDQTTLSGTFKGSSGNHTTYLDKCSCIDFNRRRLPCKHMYRLAMELELFGGDFSSDKTAIVEKKTPISQTVELVESFTDEQQLLLLDVIRHISPFGTKYCLSVSDDLSVLLNHDLIKSVSEPGLILPKYKKPELVELAHSFDLNETKGLLKTDLITYIVDNAGQKLLESNLKYIVVTGVSNIKYKKLLMYLHRKFEEQSYFDVPEGTEPLPLSQTVLPNDDVTELLIQYGYYHR